MSKTVISFFGVFVIAALCAKNALNADSISIIKSNGYKDYKNMCR